MFRQLRSQKGLTLVELMVVVAIIAIIAAVAITVFQDIQKKAKLAADQGNLAAMRSAVAIYYGKHDGTFPQSIDGYRGLGDPEADVAVQGHACVRQEQRQAHDHLDHQRLLGVADASGNERRPWRGSRSRWWSRSSMRSRAWASSTRS